MREILFRGKRDKKYNRQQEWTYGVPYIDNEGDCIMADDCSRLVVQPETVGQYTGLTDKNGKKIFEGDIVKIKDYSKGCALNYEQPTSNWVVKWNDKYAQFTIDYMALLPYKHFDESEVIGNIHDNPELLGGESDA